MNKKSTFKTVIGLILIFIIAAAYLLLVAVMGYKYGGGLILILPVIWTIQYIWNKLVVQKVKIPTQINTEKIVNIPNSEVVGTPVYSKNVDHQETVTANTNTSRGYFTRVVDFLTFQSPTYRSVFDEGQRRVVMVVSLIAPFLIAYIWVHDSEESVVASLIFYLIFHVICLVYIWIREGQNKVRPGGNALKTIRNFILPLVLFAVLIGAAGTYYDTIYLPQKREKEMRRKFDQYHNNLAEKNWLMMESILSINLNGINPSAYIKGMENDLIGKEFTKWEIYDVIIKDRNTLVGKFSYTIKDKKGSKSKKITTTLTFTNHYSDPFIEKIEFTEID